jgi:hypothetical protein
LSAFVGYLAPHPTNCALIRVSSGNIVLTVPVATHAILSRIGVGAIDTSIYSGTPGPTIYTSGSSIVVDYTYRPISVAPISASNIVSRA